MAALPYMKLYPADYLADTNHLTTEEHGAYLLLLMNYWQSGKPLDNRKGQLAKIARLSNERWAIVEQTLASFFTIRRGIWSHQRVENDLQFVLSKSTKASVSGRISGVKRANERSTFVKRSLTYTDTEADTDTETDKKKKDIHQPKVDGDSDFNEFWKIYPRKIGKGQARKAFKAALKKTTLEVILAGVETMKADPLLESEFTPHPATWLNGERWLDDPQPKVKGQTGLKLAPTPIPEPFKAISRPDVVPMPTNIREIALKGATQ